MQVGIVRETRPGERQMAATPETVATLAALGLDVIIEAGAGVESGFADDAYESAGASVVPQLALETVDVCCHVRALSPADAARLKEEAVTIGLASPASELPTVSAFAARRVTSFALELVPRISRAQSMDALSSQALVAGYRAVLEAAARFPRFFPLYMKIGRASCRERV